MNIPKYSLLFQQFFDKYTQGAKDIYFQLPPEATKYLQEIISGFFNKIALFISAFTTSLINTFASLPGIFIFVIITIVATFFFTKDRTMLKGFLYRQLPSEWEQKIISLKTDFFSSLAGL